MAVDNSWANGDIAVVDAHDCAGLPFGLLGRARCLHVERKLHVHVSRHVAHADASAGVRLALQLSYNGQGRQQLQLQNADPISIFN